MVPKVKEQKTAQKLRLKGLSLNEISRSLNVSKSSVSVWVRNISLGEKQKERLFQREYKGGIKGRFKSIEFWKRYRIEHPKTIKFPRWPQRDVESFFDTWTDDMAWVLGYFASDGTMYCNHRGSCYIAFTSADIELLNYIKLIMGISNKIEYYQSPKIHLKPRYTIQIGSKRLFNKLLDLGFTPNKSCTLSFPDIPDQHFPHFFRGYFDGDGSASFTSRIRKDRNGRSYYKLVLNLTCGSKIFLKEIQKKNLALFNIQGGSLSPKLSKKHKTCYQLVYSTLNVLKLFSFIYPQPNVPCLQRKRDILERGMSFWGRSSVG